MLSERQLQALLKVFEQRMQDVVANYIRLMAEHLRDIGRLRATDIHRVTQLARLHYNIEDIKRQIAKAANQSVADIDAVFRAVAQNDMEFANEVFASNHSRPIKNIPFQSLSSPLERILEAQLRITSRQMMNLSQTTIDSTLYQRAVDVAIQTVQSGLTDYKSAIRKAMKDAARAGVRIGDSTYVQYPNSPNGKGRFRRLDSAVRQNVLDGVRSLNQDIMDQLGKEYGADGVELSAHALCALDHLPHQGKQFTNEEFEKLQESLDRKIGQWNCKHIAFPIIYGVTPPAYSEEQLQRYDENSSELITIDGRTKTRYDWTQEQRALETAVRREKDAAIAAKASGDDLLRRKTQRRINALQDEYEKVSREAGLNQKRDRMAVSGFRKVKTVDELQSPPARGIMQVGGVYDNFDRKLERYSFEDDLRAVNPNYSSRSFKWKNNCQRCVSTFEMRLRGYDVTAKPLLGKLEDDYLAKNFEKVWEGARRLPCGNDNGKVRIEKLMQNWGDGAHAIVYVEFHTPDFSAGHVFFAIQQNGTTIYVDPQNAMADCKKYFELVALGKTSICRIDRLTPTQWITSCCDNAR